MKQIRTVDAVGHVLCHDMTQIIPGKFKGPAFRKGHVVTKEDIPVLLSMGKESLYVWEKTEGMLHEDEAAAVLRDLAMGPHMTAGDASEGKIELKAACDGLFKVNSRALRTINATPQMMIATRFGNTPVKAGDKLAGTRIIPLVIEKEKMDVLVRKTYEVTHGAPVLELKPYVHKKVGIVTTGSEVYHGRIEDQFTPVLLRKLEEFDTELVGHKVTDDHAQMTSDAIRSLLDAGADVILCTGGMSVDPDDRTPLAIRNTGADIVTYGAPVLPGAMFLLAYLPHAETASSGCGRVICGLPGCVMYAKRTIFDLLLPRIMADDPISEEEIHALGEGGLCLGCGTCTYPDCSFGKGRI
jgi:molybdopterin biosynthesis enzyme